MLSLPKGNLKGLDLGVHSCSILIPSTFIQENWVQQMTVEKGWKVLITIDSLTCSENRENPSSVEDETWKVKLFVAFKGVTNAKTNSSSKCNQHTKPKKKKRSV